MPKQSRTVNLHGFSPDEFRALVLETWFGEFPGAGNPPDNAVAAIARLDAAGRDARTSVSKVPRASLAAWVAFLRRNNAPRRSGFGTALAKVEARLTSKPGRPAAPDLWGDRARDAARAARRLKRDLGRHPTDGEIEAAMQWPPGILRKWRNYKPGTFPPAA